MRFVLICFALVCLMASCAVQAATSAQVFVGRPNISWVRISPSGEFMALALEQDGKRSVITYDIRSGEPKPYGQVDFSAFYIRRVEWLNDQRLMAVVQSFDPKTGQVVVIREVGKVSGQVYPAQLAAFNVDGSNMRPLLADRRAQRYNFKPGRSG